MRCSKPSGDPLRKAITWHISGAWCASPGVVQCCNSVSSMSSHKAACTCAFSMTCANSAERKRGIVGTTTKPASMAARKQAAIMGLLPRTTRIDGSITYKGQELVDLPRKRAGKFRGSEIGMIFQHPMTSLNPVY